MPEERSVEYWLDRAEEARVRAEGMRDAEARKMMLGVATTYEAIAKQWVGLIQTQRDTPVSRVVAT